MQPQPPEVRLAGRVQPVERDLRLDQLRPQRPVALRGRAPREARVDDALLQFQARRLGDVREDLGRARREGLAVLLEPRAHRFQSLVGRPARQRAPEALVGLDERARACEPVEAPRREAVQRLARQAVADKGHDVVRRGRVARRERPRRGPARGPEGVVRRRAVRDRRGRRRVPEDVDVVAHQRRDDVRRRVQGLGRPERREAEAALEHRVPLAELRRRRVQARLRPEDVLAQHAPGLVRREAPPRLQVPQRRRRVLQQPVQRVQRHGRRALGRPPVVPERLRRARRDPRVRGEARHARQRRRLAGVVGEEQRPRPAAVRLERAVGLGQRRRHDARDGVDRRPQRHERRALGVLEHLGHGLAQVLAEVVQERLGRGLVRQIQLLEQRQPPPHGVPVARDAGLPEAVPDDALDARRAAPHGLELALERGAARPRRALDQPKLGDVRRRGLEVVRRHRGVDAGRAVPQREHVGRRLDGLREPRPPVVRAPDPLGEGPRAPRGVLAPAAERLEARRRARDVRRVEGDFFCRCGCHLFSWLAATNELCRRRPDVGSAALKLSNYVLAKQSLVVHPAAQRWPPMKIYLLAFH